MPPADSDPNTAVTAQSNDDVTAWDKRAWREHLRKKRRSVTPGKANEAAERAAALLTSSSLWRQMEHLAVYRAADRELDPAPLCRAAWNAGKTLYLPRVEPNRGLSLIRWDQATPLRSGPFNIEYPDGEPVPIGRLDAVLTPLVGWHPLGFRLGMGGGYYDRLFAQPEISALRIGLGFALQRCDDLHRLAESTDQKLDWILTESSLQRLHEPGQSKAGK